MGSVGNSDQKWPSDDTYKDCSKGICSMYCPQWCDIIFPPPPPFTSLGYDRDRDDDDSFYNNFSPLIIAIIGILATAFVFICYYTLISECCRRRNHVDENSTLESNDQLSTSSNDLHGSGGLDESVIKSITTAKYKTGDGLIEGIDCSVCLDEFQENESLRLLPKCNHAFHVPCIDTWLKSHASCPLCRANIVVVTLVSTHPPAPT